MNQVIPGIGDASIRSSVSRSSIAAFLFGAATVEVMPYGLRIIRTRQPSRELSLSEIACITSASGLFWSGLTLETEGQGTTTLKGFGKRELRLFLAQVERHQNALSDSRRMIRANENYLVELAGWVDRGLMGSMWVSRGDVEARLALIDVVNSVCKVPPEMVAAGAATVGVMRKVIQFARSPNRWREQANERFVSRELAGAKSFFDNIETSPLTQSQRRAVVTGEPNTLVVAGAGAGKTSVIVAKAGYLVGPRGCVPQQVLVLAFNKSAADEIAARISERVRIQVRVSTFHALGLDIIGVAEGKKPSLSAVASDRGALTAMIRSMIEGLSGDPEVGDALRAYFGSYFAPYSDEHAFRDLGEYYAHLRNTELSSIRGERVKSFGEAAIANFLFLHGVEYNYERYYEIDTADQEHRRYQPDFYLPEYGIYIEHFGTDRQGGTAPYIDASAYAASIEWKRKLHKRHGTKMIETFHFMQTEGWLTQGLAEKLQRAGVRLRPVSVEVLLDALQRRRMLDPFSDLLGTFLGHFKGSELSIDGVRARARERGLDSPRLVAFLDLLWPIYQRYQAMLAEAGEVDFNDMICRAARLVEDGQYQSPFRHILIDEFQDTSASRRRLLVALGKQNPGTQIFAVGDDWQSILRFAGSDTAYMRDFGEHFPGGCEMVALDRTFRLNSSLQRVAGRFIMANPGQIPKQILAYREAKGARVFVHQTPGEQQGSVEAPLAEISKALQGRTASVLLLGRYGFLGSEVPWRQIRERFKNLDVTFSTVHSAKGIEADFVVLLGIQGGRFGFPSEMVQDPIVDVVLAAPDRYPHAEERRLMYVALTRARHAVYIMTNRAAPSSFVTELLTYAGDVEARGAAAHEIGVCPECRSGTLVQREGRIGMFYSCSNYPYCKYKIDPCPECGLGVLLQKERVEYACSNRGCGHTERICPSCRDGMLVRVTGPHGAFLSCSNYRSRRCEYTESIRD